LLLMMCSTAVLHSSAAAVLLVLVQERTRQQLQPNRFKHRGEPTVCKSTALTQR
jgi:hypothetical protein